MSDVRSAPSLTNYYHSCTTEGALKKKKIYINLAYYRYIISQLVYIIFAQNPRRNIHIVNYYYYTHYVKILYFHTYYTPVRAFGVFYISLYIYRNSIKRSKSNRLPVCITVMAESYFFGKIESFRF